ncbi:MAG: 3-dehydroquinate synthase, partial [Alphaproteobacteria bacterium]|nr:3-dehydroquinate synthase [Alphaproteobacteria bacterium]
PGLLARAGAEIGALKPGRVHIVTDGHVATRYLAAVTESCCNAGIATASSTLPPGEDTKRFAMLETLLDEILAHHPDRSTVLVALGGGVIGDLTGFAASALLRGVRFVQIPTTLLSQVDSAVGGKTGINTRYGKNLIGAFHQPSLVIADTDTLKTLPPRELRAGYAEVVKYGAIGDEAFFTWLEAHGGEVLACDAHAIAEAVRVSCEAKAAIVARDEKESGDRALLNFGHTFGHAIEAEAGYDGSVLHGEGVAVGMAFAAQFSESKQLCPSGTAQRLIRHLRAHGLPASLADLKLSATPEALLAHMRHDKKNQDGKITLILLKRLGEAFVAKGVPESEILDFLRQ